ncbi:hypothetical protein MY11210_005648 [Beauveria gryllotalpidicola]
MAHTTYNPRHKNWKTILNERIDLYKAVSRSGDTAKVDLILLRDQLAHEDHYLTLIDSVLDKETDGAIAPADDVHKLHALANGGNQKVLSMYHHVHDSMAKLKASGEDKPLVWKQDLKAKIDENDKKTLVLWEGLRKDGIDTITDMPEDAREPAAITFTTALGFVAELATKAAKWLKDAAASVASWLKKGWEKIVEIGQKIHDYFANAWHMIQKIFGRTNYAILASEPAVNIPTGSGESDSNARHVDNHSHHHGDYRHSGCVASE